MNEQDDPDDRTIKKRAGRSFLTAVCVILAIALTIPTNCFFGFGVDGSDNYIQTEITTDISFSSPAIREALRAPESFERALHIRSAVQDDLPEDDTDTALTENEISAAPEYTENDEAVYAGETSESSEQWIPETEQYSELVPKPEEPEPDDDIADPYGMRQMLFAVHEMESELAKVFEAESASEPAEIDTAYPDAPEANEEQVEDLSPELIAEAEIPEIEDQADLFEATEPDPASEIIEEPQPYIETGESGFPIYYADDTMTITITKEWFVGAWCYIAHIQTSDYTRFKTGIAAGGYGARESVSSFNERSGSILAINGDYAEGYSLGVIRDGQVYLDGFSTAKAIYSQATGLFSRNQDDMYLSELAAQGYTDTFEFNASPLVVDGVCIYGRKDGGKSAQRTLLGCTGIPGDIYLVVTEGRYSDGESRGLQYYEAGDLLESLGCEYGLALDGGGSSEMIFNGKVLNHAEGRRVTGFVYVR